MSPALLIAAREFLGNARTQGFWFGILMVPLLWVIASQVPLWLARKGTPTRHFALVDATRAGGSAGVILGHLRRMEERRGSMRFREWAAPRLLPGRSLPAIVGSGTSWPDLRSQVAGSMRPDAGGFTPPEPLHRPVVLPAGLAWRGDLAEFEGRLRDWLREGRPCPAEDRGEPVALFAAALVLDGEGPGDPPVLRFWSDNQADTSLRDAMAEALSREHRRAEYGRRGVDPALVGQVEAARARVVDLNPRKAAGEEQVGLADQLRQWAPSVFVYLLWIAVFAVSQMLLNSLIEERSNRILEVLVSSVTPLQLMVGKLLGVAAVGAVMALAWIGSLVLVTAWMVGSSGIAAVAPDSAIARLPLELATLLGDSWILPAFGLYFVLGYLFYSAVILALGSTCSDLKEAQNFTGVIALFMMVPLVSITFIPKDPNGPIATWLSWIPPYTPFVMMNRVAASPPWFDVVGTLMLLVISDILVLWACARVFRRAVLRTGQPASLAQLARWIFGRG
jgi:ABC-2 type transport system permease protein